MKFRLLAGIHHEREPDGTVRRYSAKDAKVVIITTDRNLVQIFGPSKFERVDYAEPSAAEVNTTGVVVPTATRLAQKVLQGQAPANPPPTTPKSPKKPPPPAPKPSPKSARQVEESAVAVAEPEEDAGLGEDVTAEFPTAIEMGFQVYRRDGLHQVVEQSTTRPLHPEPLDAEGVEAFVEQYA